MPKKWSNQSKLELSEPDDGSIKRTRNVPESNSSCLEPDDGTITGDEVPESRQVAGPMKGRTDREMVFNKYNRLLWYTPYGRLGYPPNNNWHLIVTIKSFCKTCHMENMCIILLNRIFAQLNRMHKVFKYFIMPWIT